MKKYLFTLLVLIVLFPFFNNPFSYSWGFFAHKRINKMAVFTLPPEMIGFYKKHIEFISQHAVDPDRRRYSIKEEAVKHYIDIDHYSKDTPFATMPKQWKEAIEKYTEDTLRKYGILPWNILWTSSQLTAAFKNKQTDKILRLSADLGHYMADAHVPLHTTENHNGQLTNQKGIHGFWESRLPELYAENYDYWVGKVQYIDNILNYTWNSIEESHNAKDSVLLLEKQLNASFPSDKKYSYVQKGKKQLKNYSEEYAKEYNIMLNGMVERRMCRAVLAIGSIWYTSWVNAGQPDLYYSELKDTTQTECFPIDTVLLKSVEDYEE